MIEPGSLVMIDNSSGTPVFFTHITRYPGIISDTNPDIGKFLRSQLALVIGTQPYMNDRAADVLILTSSGVMGWCYASRLERVTE